MATPHTACGFLVPQPEVEPELPVVEVQSFYHWTPREFPGEHFFLKVEERLVTKRKGKIKSKHTTPPPPPPPKNLNIKQRCSNEQPEERINLAMLLRLLGTYFWSNLYKRATLVSPLALLCTASLASMQNLTTALRRKTFFGLWASGVLDRAQTTSTGL